MKFSICHDSSIVIKRTRSYNDHTDRTALNNVIFNIFVLRLKNSKRNEPRQPVIDLFPVSPTFNELLHSSLKGFHWHHRCPMHTKMRFISYETPIVFQIRYDKSAISNHRMLHNTGTNQHDWYQTKKDDIQIISNLGDTFPYDILSFTVNENVVGDTFTNSWPP